MLSFEKSRKNISFLSEKSVSLKSLINSTQNDFELENFIVCYKFEIVLNSTLILKNNKNQVNLVPQSLKSSHPSVQRTYSTITAIKNECELYSSINIYAGLAILTLGWCWFMGSSIDSFTKNIWLL